MNPGILKHRIKVYRPPNPETDLDDAGQPLDEPIHHADVWAAIYPLRGRDLESARQVHGEVTTRIIVRYRKDIDNKMFAEYEGIRFEFLYIIHKDFAKKELHIMAKEVQ